MALESHGSNFCEVAPEIEAAIARACQDFECFVLGSVSDPEEIKQARESIVAKFNRTYSEGTDLFEQRLETMIEARLNPASFEEASSFDANTFALNVLRTIRSVITPRKKQPVVKSS